MKRLLCNLLIWLLVHLIALLGGVTKKAMSHEIDNREGRIWTLEEENRALSGVNREQQEEIRRLMFDLSCSDEKAVKLLGEKTVKRYRTEGEISLHMLRRDPRPQEQTLMINRKKEEVAGKLGRELLKAGAIIVRESKDNRSNDYVIRMEVEILC